jgi:heme exporter protein D
MAEAACLSLASAIWFSLNLTGVNFLSNCEQLIHFFRNEDLANLPDWRIKYYTQSFVNFTSAITPSIYKIRRQLNTIADSLARQARQLQTPQQPALEFLCALEDHTSSCNVQQALQCVGLTGVTILVATCCN